METNLEKEKQMQRSVSFQLLDKVSSQAGGMRSYGEAETTSSREEGRLETMVLQLRPGERPDQRQPAPAVSDGRDQSKLPERRDQCIQKGCLGSSRRFKRPQNLSSICQAVLAKKVFASFISLSTSLVCYLLPVFSSQPPKCDWTD